MNYDCEKKTLWKAIHQYGFVLDELILYLDTHPNDKYALAEFEKTKKIYDECFETYCREYGPLIAKNSKNGDKFSWACAPMPWEMEVYA